MNHSGQSRVDIMKSRTLLILLLSICLLAPVVANPNGPPWVNPINGGLTVETGCTCHGDGVPSNDVVVSISGVPRAYTAGESYDFTVNLQHASYENGGFLLTDYGVGTFTAGGIPNCSRYRWIRTWCSISNSTKQRLDCDLDRTSI